MKPFIFRMVICCAPFVMCTFVETVPSFSRPLNNPLVSHGFAAIQFTSGQGAFAENKARLTMRILEASRKGARYVVTPELALIGEQNFFHRNVELGQNVIAETIPGPTTEYFGGYSRRLRIWLVISLLEKNEDGFPFLTTVLLDDLGKVVNKYRKIKVPWKLGKSGIQKGSFRDTIHTVDDKGLRLGVLAGEDIQVGVPRLADRGAQAIFIAAAWSNRDPINWDNLCRQLSKKHKVNLIVANRRNISDSSQVGSLMSGGIYTIKGERILPRSRYGVELVFAEIPSKVDSWRIPSSLGLPESIPGLTNAESSYAVAELGRKLFLDEKLSSTGTVSCATCHVPEKAFANGHPKGIGVHGRKTKRNVPSLLNIAFRPLLRWDGYASSLENFVKYPISGFNEMNFPYSQFVFFSINRVAMLSSDNFARSNY